MEQVGHVWVLLACSNSGCPWTEGEDVEQQERLWGWWIEALEEYVEDPTWETAERIALGEEPDEE